MFAPSIIYRPGDPWITLAAAASILPAVPVSGAGRALYQPIWARDVARCVASSLNGTGPDKDANGRYELAGPEVLSYDDIVEAVLEANGRTRPLLHVPLPWSGRGCGRSSCSAAHPSSRPGRRRS